MGRVGGLIMDGLGLLTAIDVVGTDLLNARQALAERDHGIAARDERIAGLESELDQLRAEVAELRGQRSGDGTGNAAT